jgi:PAS domain S-box-containing protein
MSPPEASAATRPRILLVEDDATLLSHVAQALSVHYVVDSALNGMEALRVVLRAKPELIVTDIVMPEMDGVELLRILRSVPSTQAIPVLLISGRAPETQRIEGFNEGADGYLAKPYTVSELSALVGSMLHSARQRSDAARREAREEAERQAQAERAALLESITDAFYALDEQWRFTYVNQHALDYYGKTSQELLGQSIWDMLPETKGTVFEDQYQRARQEGRPAAFEVLSSLTGRWLDLRVYPTRQGLAVYFRDVSHRKRAEQELRFALDRLRGRELLLALATNVAGLGVFTWDAKTDRITLENERAHELLQAMQESPPSGREFLRRLVHPQDRKALRRRLIASGRAGEAVLGTCRIRPGESWRWIEIHGGFETADDGTSQRLVGVFSDTTERKHAEESLREADRRKDEFLALLAHELRNPLAPVRNGLQILRHKAPEDPLLKRTISMMDRQLKHLVRLVDDLMDVSRISSGKLQLRREKVLLTGAIANAIEVSHSTIDARRHELVVDTRVQGLMVEGDPDRLVQIFSNLLTNSAKYTDPGGRIIISLDREADEAVIAVKDNGIGIPVQALESIFQMFLQVRSHGARNHEGLGIGLALVRSLVEMHRGKINAASDGLGTGSTFTVRLPLIDAPPNTRAVIPETVSDVTLHPGEKRVLVVDDNVDAAQSLEWLLQMTGYEVRTAADGSEALEQAQAFRPNIVFMDLGLPGMDGVEAARRIRALPNLAPVKIVAMTGWGQSADRVRSSEAGMDEHLVKPVALEALNSVLLSLER